MASALALKDFRNEPYTDFTQPGNRQVMESAMAKVRGLLGREYDLVIGGERIRCDAKFHSTNPSRPGEVVGIHQMATRELANRAIETAYKNFPAWSRTPALDRVEMLLRTAELLRERKYEFDAWLTFEAGKTWPEAEAEVAEAIDFCEYYAREMARLAGPQTVVQLPGERDEMRYLPLGVGVVIPPWNFPLAILAGMTCAALVSGNTVIIKPSSEAPAVAAVFAELLLEAGFPPESCF
jgi:1-pyrroline-5-carboxylate dehydrogenase